MARLNPLPNYTRHGTIRTPGGIRSPYFFTGKILYCPRAGSPGGRAKNGRDPGEQIPRGEGSQPKRLNLRHKGSKKQIFLQKKFYVVLNRTQTYM